MLPFIFKIPRELNFQKIKETVKTNVKIKNLPQNTN